MKINKILAIDDFIASNYPKDLVMPLRAGEKHPLYCHRDGTWSRRKFREFMTKCTDDMEDKFDFAVLMHDLVVVDVDDVMLAESLECRFPALVSAPAEQTRRGRHYWFKRSNICEEEGFYDGAGQVVKGVDLKTRCWIGTSGIVVVAPSTDKSWIRCILSTNIFEIPEDLLRAIAVPRLHSSKLVFLDGVVADHPSSFLKTMLYFEPFFDSGDDSSIGDKGGCIPVPCASKSFTRMFEIFDSKPQPWDASEVKDAAYLADKLMMKGSAEKTVALLSHMLYLKDLGRFMITSGTIPLVDSIVYQGQPPDLPEQTRMFSHYPRHSFFSLGQDTVSAELIRDVKRDGGRIHQRVLDLLIGYNLVLAGGSALWACCEHVPKGSDYDLFVYGVDEEGADSMVSHITASLEEEGFKCMRTDRALTFVSVSLEDIIIQIILRIYSRPEEVVSSFDIGPCKVAIWHCKDKHEMRVEATQEFIESMRYGSFIVPIHQWHNSSVARILKYVAKGFDVYFPGLRRSCVEPSIYEKKPSIDKTNKKIDARCLFYAERRLSELMPCRRPSLDNDVIWRIARELFLPTSDYEDEESYDLLYYSRRAYYVLVGLVMRGVHTMTSLLRPSKKPLPTPKPYMLLWNRYSKDTIGSANFPRHDPCIASMFDSKSYACVASLELGLDALPFVAHQDKYAVFSALWRELVPKVNFKLYGDIYEKFYEKSMRAIKENEDYNSLKSIETRVKEMADELGLLACGYASAIIKFTPRRTPVTLKHVGQGDALRGLELYMQGLHASDADAFVDACLDELKIEMQLKIDSNAFHEETVQALCCKHRNALIMRDEFIKIFRLYGANKCLSFFRFLDIRANF